MIRVSSSGLSRFGKVICLFLTTAVLAGNLMVLPANVVQADKLAIPVNMEGTDIEVPASENIESKTLPPFDPTAGGEGIEGFVSRLYSLGLGRETHINSNNYYVKQITSGAMSGGQAAKIILNSNEFKAFGYSNEDFVEVLYRVFFNRTASGGGRDYWLSVLSRGTDRSRVIDSFINSVEWVTICDDYGIASGATISPTPTPRVTNTPRPTNAPTATATPTGRPQTSPTNRPTLPPFNPEAGGEGIEGFVSRLYSLGLGRETQINSNNYYVKQIVSGAMSGGQAAKIILTSNEFQTFGYSDEDFVEVLYRVFFNRTATGSGRDYWLGVLSRGTSRSKVIDSFINSNEWRNICEEYGISSGAPNTPTPRPTNTNTPTPVSMAPFDPEAGGNGVIGFVTRLYNIGLGRQVTIDSNNYYVKQLTTGKMTGGQVAKIILTSNEFNAFGYSNADFVEVLYRIFFNRPASGGGRDYWIGVLNNGTSRSKVIDSFINSGEWMDVCDIYGIASGSRNTPTPRPTIVVVSYEDQLVHIANQFEGENVYAYGMSANTYMTMLDMIFASGEDVPDIFAVDMSFGTHYFNSAYAVPISSLGIRESELRGMYPYTIDYATGADGELYGLAWAAQPQVVFYNTVVAQETLGVSDPESVAPYFASWDAFLETSRTVSATSGGTVRAVADWSEFSSTFVGSRSDAWLIDGDINVDNGCFDLFNLARIFVEEDLTFGIRRSDSNWNSLTSDHTVLSFWGTMEFGQEDLRLKEYMYEGNPTASEWRVVPAPVNAVSGGTWMVASRNANKGCVARVMRSLATNEMHQREMSTDSTGRIFVNNSNLNQEYANTEDFRFWLGGQNIYGILDATARAVNTTFAPTDGFINNAFIYAVEDYISGASREEALDGLRERLGYADDEVDPLIYIGLDDPYEFEWIYLALRNQYMTVSFTPDEDGIYTFYTTGNMYTSLELHHGPSSSYGDMTANSSLTVYLRRGVTYQLDIHNHKIGAYGRSSTIHVVRGEYECPVATPIPMTLGVPVNLRTSNFTSEAYVCLEFTPDESGAYTFTSRSINYPSIEMIGYYDSDMKPVIAQASDQDFRLEVNLEAGVTYLFKINCAIFAGVETSVTVRSGGNNPITPTAERNEVDLESPYVLNWNEMNEPRTTVVFTPEETGHYTFVMYGSQSAFVSINDSAVTFLPYNQLSFEADMEAGQDYMIRISLNKVVFDGISELCVYEGAFVPEMDVINMSLDEMVYVNRSDAGSNFYILLEFTPEVEGDYSIISYGEWFASIDAFDFVDNYGNYIHQVDGAENSNFRLDLHLEAGVTYRFGVKSHFTEKTPMGIMVTNAATADIHGVHSISLGSSRWWNWSDFYYSDSDTYIYRAFFAPEVSGEYHFATAGSSDVSISIPGVEGGFMDGRNQTGNAAVNVYLEAGETYLINVEVSRIGFSTYAELYVEIGSQPMPTIPCYDLDRYGNYFSATDCQSYREFMVSFTPAISGAYRIYSLSDVDPVITMLDVYNADGSEITDDNGGDGNNFNLDFYFEKGTTYYFVIRFNSYSDGPFRIRFSNDGTATPIPTMTPTPEPTEEPTPTPTLEPTPTEIIYTGINYQEFYYIPVDGSVDEDGFYFCFTPEEDGYYTIWASGDNHPVIYALDFEGTDGEVLTNEDLGPDVNYELNLGLEAGVTYHFRIVHLNEEILEPTRIFIDTSGQG